MQIDIMTLFPEAIDAMMNESILGRAQKNGLIRITAHQIRDYTTNRQKQVDDAPYGGGMGMVMNADPLYRLWQTINCAARKRVHTIYLSPQGKVFDQNCAKRLLNDYDHLILVCGHYEGIDERFIEECVDEEISMGDFVLTGGELPAMAVIDAVSRMVPGVLSQESSYENESHFAGLLEYPQYTRPEEFMGMRIPDVLISGHHAKIEEWKRRESLRITKEKRPDLLEKAELTPKDRAYLMELEQKKSF